MNDIHALSGAYAVDALDPAERLAFEEHLAVCSNCRTEVAELQEASGLLAELSTAVAPPPELRDAVLSQIRTVRPLPPLPSLPPAPQPHGVVVELRPRRMLRTSLAAAAAVIALVGVGIGVTQPWHDDTSQTPSASDRVLTADDAQSVTLEFPGRASARLVRSVSQRRAVLVTDNMPAAPKGSVYQLWLLAPDGAMVSAGVMGPGADQTMLLSGDASRATGAGITVEPEGGSPQPTTDPIALFDLAAAS